AEILREVGQQHGDVEVRLTEAHQSVDKRELVDDRNVKIRAHDETPVDEDLGIVVRPAHHLAAQVGEILKQQQEIGGRAVAAVGDAGRVDHHRVAREDL